MGRNGETVRLEVVLPEQGGCVFDAVNEAVIFFGKPPLALNLRDEYIREIEDRVAEYKAAVAEEGLGDWVLLTTEILLSKLGAYGVSSDEIICFSETAEALDELEFTAKTGIDVRSAVGKIPAFHWPAIFFYQNEINPDATHIFFSSNTENWGKKQKEETIPGDRFVAILPLKV